MIQLQIAKYNKQQAIKLFDTLYSGYKQEILSQNNCNLGCTSCEDRRVCKDVGASLAYLANFISQM